MTDERAAEGVEHLQAAARELLAAARSFLDVVEDVVEDRARFADAATVVGEAVRDGLGLVGRRTGSWPEPDVAEPFAADSGPDAGPDAGPVASPDASPEPAADTSAVSPEADPEVSPDAVPEAPPADRTEPSRTSRVRRIPVD